MRKKYIFTFIVLLFFGNKLFSQPVIKTNWHALIIGEDTHSTPNTFQRYRYKFNLHMVPAKAIAAIATDSKYWLWLNGKLVVFEGQLKRGPTPNDTYYDEVDLKSYLQKGTNTICILVWYWGKDGFSHKSSGKAGLLFECDLNDITIKSNTDWKVSKHMAYLHSTAPFPNFRLPEFNIHYDARKDDEQWIQPTFDDSKWKQAIVIGKPGAAPWNALWKRPIPHWYNSGLLNYVNKISAKHGKQVMKLPKNLTITPYFKIQAPAGLLITIQTDNYNGGGATNIRTEYITKEGIQEYESPAYFNGHEVIYTFPESVNVLDLKYRETKYNTTHVGYFKTNDSFYNKLWNKSAVTLNVNMRDGIFDSPERERAQWWGDIVIVLEEIFYSCDANGIPAIKKAISNLVEWQKPSGVLFSPVPAGNWDKELPAQMLASVSKYGIWKYVEMSGDTAMIRYTYPFIKKYMGLWKLNEKGLVQHRSGDWDWHDWGDKIDVPLLDNAWYYMALDACNKMASYLQLKEDAANYQQQMESIKSNFQKHFWKGNRFASDNYMFYADDRGNGLAVCAGLVSKEQWNKLKPVLDTTFYAGPYLEKYILESYFLMNDAAAGLTRMKNRYAEMVESPITTLWEGWEIGSSTYGGGTYNHGWTGGPLSLLSGYAAGIRPLSIGYNNYLIKPQLGTLKYINCKTLTPKGFISISVEAKEGSMKMNVETVDAVGSIAVPKLSGKAKLLSISSKRILKYKREDEYYWYYECKKKALIQIITSW